VVHAIGPSGIGKSAMLRSFARGVEDIDGALVLRGRCYERESVPYNAFDGVVDDLAEYLATLSPVMLNPVLPAWIGELARVFPALDAVPAIVARALPADTVLEAVELRRRAWTALRELLAAVSHACAVVVIIDDLHWADADSAHLLERVVADASRARLFFVAGFRPAEAAANRALADYLALGRRFTGEGRLFELSIGPLPPAEAELLARATLRDLGGQASERRLRFLAEEAQGVPFFIEELARFVAGRDDALDEEVSLDHAIRARVQALPSEQRGLLEMAAVADIPVPQSLLFTAAGVAAEALPSLLALRSGSLVGWSGAGVDDRVSVYHDRIRESVIAGLDDGARAVRHLALGRAMSARHFAQPGAWAFEAVRHLSAAGALLDDAQERLTTARLAREAGRQARQAAAFPLAFACFERGIALLPPDAWETSYQLALDLHSGAAEAAYLIAEWTAMEARCAAIKAHARTALDQIVAWEVQIDAFIGRHEYVAALDVGLQALSLLGVELPRDPGQADIVAAFERTLADLSTMTPESLSALPDVDDPTVAAAMRIQVRISPGAFFGKPTLLPIIACNLVQTSIKRGLSMATPFALALFGIVLNSVGLFPVSHAWGQLAVTLLSRWPDRRLEAATRHLVFNLVCPWMVPLSSILEPLREVWDIGRRTGDLEYASYAAHGYIHNAMYAGRPLAPLVVEAREIGAQMRALGQVNALHVHEPFEKLLEAYTGKLRHLPRLDDVDFNEQASLDAAAREGSRSGCFIVHLAIGLARFYLGDRRDASTHFEQARSFLDAAPSTWHIPILHQHAALAACLSGNAALRPKVEESLAALRALAAHTPANFAHRVSMVEAELARLDGDTARARDCLAAARVAALDGEWTSDVALVDELSGDYAGARDGYAAWGATAIAARLA
jgi:predicted ATPase